MSKPKLLDQVCAVMRLQHLSLATEHAYVQWIKRFIMFHKMKHPLEMGATEFANFSHISPSASKSHHRHKIRRSMLFYSSMVMYCTRILVRLIRSSEPRNRRVYLNSLRLQKLDRSSLRYTELIVSWSVCSMARGSD